MKKKYLIIIIVAVIVTVGIVIGGCSYYCYCNYLKVTSVVTIDVNPSIALELNKKNRVVRSKALNNDAKELKISAGSTLKDSVKKITAYLKDNQKLEVENTVLINITGTISENTVISDIKEAFKSDNSEATIIVPKVDSNSKKLATELKISEIKAAYLLTLSSEDDSINVSEYATKSVNEISKKIDEAKVKLEDKTEVDLTKEETTEVPKTTETTKTTTESTTKPTTEKRMGTNHKCERVNDVIGREPAAMLVINNMGATYGSYCGVRSYESVGSETSSGVCAYRVTISYRGKTCVTYVGLETGSILEQSCKNIDYNMNDNQCLIMKYAGITNREDLRLITENLVGNEYVSTVYHGKGDKYEYRMNIKTGNVTRTLVEAYVEPNPTEGPVNEE